MSTLAPTGAGAEMNTMIDPFGRAVTYLRVSVTDRCDFRCVYCMSEDMEFLPRQDLLSLEELERVCAAFIRQGVRRLRLTGGEPLVRRNVLQLVERLGARLGNGLDELTLTTNGSQLSRFATQLVQAGVKRINVSLDTLDANKFAAITRWGRLAPVLDGISAAKSAGLKIKINMVALRGVNEDEFDAMIAWCGNQGFDLCLIETMPLGEIDAARADQYLPLSLVRARLDRRWTLRESAYTTPGPARYVEIGETSQLLGFITPMTHNFCENCNRVRLTCTGMLYMCLGRDDSVDLRTPLRNSNDDGALESTMRAGIAAKPKGHDFVISRRSPRPAVARHMSVTGG